MGYLKFRGQHIFLSVTDEMRGSYAYVLFLLSLNVDGMSKDSELQELLEDIFSDFSDSRVVSRGHQS